jgi:replicative DNA helicase
MAYNLGLKALRRLVESQNAMEWHKHKVTPSLFIGAELAAHDWVLDHLTKHHQLPQLSTFEQAFPEVAEFDTPEPFSYYLQGVQERFAYNRIKAATTKANDLLKADQNDTKSALEALQQAVEAIKSQEFRTKIMDVSKDAPKTVLMQYHQALQKDVMADFGWPYMDDMSGGALPGDVISFVGRPAMGKTWLALYTALNNWRKGRTVVFVSMEMNVLAIAQRLAAMYSQCPIGQLKMGAYSSGTYKKFSTGLVEMASEKGKFYVIDGNLAACADDIYMLASQLGASSLYIDGAYLLKHKNPRLDRFTRVAENVELMKQHGTAIEIPTFASWQLNRDAAKNKKKTGQSAGLEDIGYSDAIGQISSIVLALMQEEGIETMNQRVIDVMKGRNGEVGQFPINWLFDVMDFKQAGIESSGAQHHLNYI